MSLEVVGVPAYRMFFVDRSGNIRPRSARAMIVSVVLCETVRQSDVTCPRSVTCFKKGASSSERALPSIASDT